MNVETFAKKLKDPGLLAGARPAGAAGQKEEAEPPPADDSYEEPSGDGRTSRQPVLGVQLIDGDRRLRFVPYSSIDFGEGEFNGDRFSFDFFRGRERWRVVIEGTVTHLQRVVDKLTAGKRESVRVNGETVTRITIDKA